MCEPCQNRLIIESTQVVTRAESPAYISMGQRPML